MGLIKAALGAAGGVLADQWKEFFICESIDKEILMVKGQKRIGKRSSNTKGSDNIITNGSGIVVADGQCMLIVDQGKVVEVCAEPGEFTYDTSSEPSLFTGPFGEALKETFKTIGKRFTLGGDTGKDQRVYYINTKELIDNKFGTSNPVPFRVVDSKVGMDLDVSVRCSGVYSYKIVDPIKFYTNIAGNVADEYRREELDTQLKQEFIAALQPALAKLSEMELRPNQIIAHNEDVQNALNESLSQKWGELRGLQVVSIAFGSVTLPDEDAALLKNAQADAAYGNARMGAGAMARATAGAMGEAAGNANGAMAGFMGMGMAMNASGMTPGNLYQQAAAEQQQANMMMGAGVAQAQGGWKCACGTVNTGNFCTNCGSAKPQPAGWTCACGTVNTGNFCTNCGAKSPALGN